MKTVVIDGRDMPDRITAHAYLAGKLDFPTYYGKNLDALHDCLTDISEPTQIVLYNFSEDSFSNNLYLPSIIRVLKTSATENNNISLTCDADSLNSLGTYLG